MSYTEVELGLFVVDALWNLCILFPVLVIFWSGSWDLVDIYMDDLFLHHQSTSNGMSIVIGSTVLIIAYFVLPLLKQFVSPFRCWSPKHVVVSRVSSYVTTIGCIMFWRGVWNVVCGLMGDDLQVVTAMTLMSLLLVVLLRSTVGSIGCPFGLLTDTSPHIYDAPPRFRQQMDSPFLYILDVIFSVYVISTLIVVVWAGLMKLGDELILPQDPLQSLIVSLSVGCGASLVLFALMLPHRAAVRHLSASNRPLLAYLLEVTFNIFTIVVVLLLWRGLWGLIKDQLGRVPNRIAVSWICHAIGFLGMVCLQVGVFFRGVGCVVDGEQFFADWPMEYFIVFYRLKQNQDRDSQTAIQSNLEGESDAEIVEPLLRSSTEDKHYTTTHANAHHVNC